MDLGYLVQFAVEGAVLTSSGVTRKVVNSFVYGLPDRDLSFTTKGALGANFHAQVWKGIANDLSAAFLGKHLWVTYPNTPGDAAADVMIPDSGGSQGARLPLHQCVYVGLHTNFRTRPFEGCKHLGPLDEQDAEGDELTPQALAAWQNAVAPVTQALVQFEGHEAIVLQPVVWSRVLSATSATVPAAVGGQIVRAVVNPILSQWRHRKEKPIS